MLLHLSHFFPLSPLPGTSIPSSNPLLLSSCPWEIHVSSLASPFPILFLTFPCLFCTYHLCFLIPAPFPPFSPFAPLCPVTSFPPAILPLSSCPWVVHINSLASPFPILFLTSPCLFCTYHLCFLIPAPFPPFSPFPLPDDNPPNGLHIYDSVPVLFVYLVCLF